MSMRYLLRRQNAEEFSEVKKIVSTLDATLGSPAENLRRFVEVKYAPTQYAVYQFFTKKNGEKWVWSCPSVELVGESEKDFMALTDRFQVSRGALSHLPKEIMP